MGVFYVLYVVLMLLYVIVFDFPKNNPKMFLGIMCLFAFMLMAFTSEIVDEPSYIGFFENSPKYEIDLIMNPRVAVGRGLSSDWGFSTIGYILYQISDSYYVYKALLVSFIIGVIYKFSSKYGSTIIILLLYMIYPWFMDITQIRSALMSVCVCIGFFLLQKKYGLLKYIFMVILGTLMHTSGVLFLMFVPLYYFSRYKYPRMLIHALSFIMCLLPMYGSYIQTHWFSLKIILLYADDLSKYAYQAEKTLNHYYLVGYVIVIMLIFLLIYMLKHCHDEQLKKRIEYARLMCILLTFSFPLYPILLDVSFRYPRTMLLPIYILIADYCLKEDNLFHRRVCFCGGLGVATVFCLLSLYGPANLNAFNAIVNNNWIFKILFL